jgi:hypothetical protein
MKLSWDESHIGSEYIGNPLYGCHGSLLTIELSNMRNIHVFNACNHPNMYLSTTFPTIIMKLH